MMKNWINTNQDYRFNEILFENRNKNYGAYVLRTSESYTLTKALCIGVAFFSAVSVVPLIISSFKNSPAVITENPREKIFRIKELPQFAPPEVPVVNQSKVAETTVKVEIPSPTRNAVKETPPPSVTVIEKGKIGTENVVGSPPSVQSTAVVSQVSVVAPVSVVKPVDNSPSKMVDIEANFNGGIDAFRNRVAQNLDSGAFEGAGEVMKTTVTFIVEKDGTISGIMADGKDTQFNKEAEKTIRNIKGKWTPAKYKGQNVRSYFKFPIAIQFE